MNWQNILRLAKSYHLILVPLLGLAFYITFIPHQDYPYPLHVDEWVHMAFSNSILSTGSINFADPFSGGAVAVSDKLELGFQLFWAVFHRVAGTSWPDIFRFFPSIIFMITILSVYIMTHRLGFGWEGALLACFVTTNIGVLGPALLVPVSMALMFLPLSFFLVMNYKTFWSYLALFIIICFTLSMHAPSALCIIIALIPTILLNLKGNLWHSLCITAALVLPFLLVLILALGDLMRDPWIMRSLESLLSAKSEIAYHDLPHLLNSFGWIPTGLCLLGTLFLAIKGGKTYYDLVLGLLLLLVMLVVFYVFHYGMDIMYMRGLLFTMLMMGIIGGAGLMTLRKLELPGLTAFKEKYPVIAQSMGLVICLLIVGVSLYIGIPDRQTTPFYNIIDKSDYEAFVWVRDNVDTSYEKAILDPWKATAFSAVTGKHIYTRLHTRPTEETQTVGRFLENGCADTDFLRENNISIIYTTLPCQNPDLTEIHDNVYLLKK